MASRLGHHFRSQETEASTDKIHFPSARHPELKDLVLADLAVGRVRETDKEGFGKGGRKPPRERRKYDSLKGPTRFDSCTPRSGRACRTRAGTGGARDLSPS